MERMCRIGLALCPGLEPRALRRLIRKFGSAASVWCADSAQWTDYVRMREQTVRQLDAWRNRHQPDARFEKWLAGQGIRVWVQGDADFPAVLKDLEDPPLVLFVKGSEKILHSANQLLSESHVISIVGTRRASAYGLEAAKWVSDTVARANCTIVSGLALGIDAAAHTAALAAEKLTIAVLGTGIDVCYPSAHYRLYNQIAEHGLLVSEYAPGTPPAKHRFPERNRLIAALGKAVIVIQAGEKSGALRTVDEALNIGRDVYVVPGPITSIHFRGSHRLLQQGAQILLDPIDILQDFGISVEVSQPSSVPERWRDLYDAIEETGQPGTVAIQLGLPISHVYAGLLELELAGLLQRQPDGTYLRKILQIDVCK